MKSYKYLGVNISDNGTIAPHMKTLNEKIDKTTTAIKRIKGKGIYKITNLDIFNAYLRPHLNTLTPALSHASVSTIEDFITTALRALKVAMGITPKAKIKSTL